MIVDPLSLEDFIDFIEEIPGFSFARISDGAFFCLWGFEGQNCDGVIYTPEQAASLKEVIFDDQITHGITSIALHRAAAERWLQENGATATHWYDADVMNKAADKGELLPFIQCLRKRKLVFCGPQHLTRLQSLPIASFVICHPTMAFEQRDELADRIIRHVQNTGADTVLLCAGQGASPSLVSSLHRSLPEAVILDVGSLFDPYVGVFSRSGHKRAGAKGIAALGKQNFGREVTSWWRT